jgi:hypothetical protein
VARGWLVRLDRGIYVPVIEGSDPAAVRERFAAASVAASLVTHSAVASHRSSAVLAGLPTWTLPKRPCVTVPPRFTGDAARAHLHRAGVPATEVLAGAVPRTLTARTIADVARECGLEEAVVIGDAALHLRMTDLDRIAATLATCAGWPGSRRADHLTASPDGRSESPLESVSRLRLTAAGVPAPELQTEIFDLDGRFLGRLDLYWDEFGVAGEVDGRDKFRADPFDAAWRQTRRQELLSDTGLIFVRWGRADLEDMPVLAARVLRAHRRGIRRPAVDRLWIARPTTAPSP